jgi:hypothetical protein
MWRGSSDRILLLLEDGGCTFLGDIVKLLQDQHLHISGDNILSQRRENLISMKVLSSLFLVYVAMFPQIRSLYKI